MNQNNVNGFEKREAFAGRRCEQLPEHVKAGNAKNNLALRALWLILGVACAVLGSVLLSILLR